MKSRFSSFLIVDSNAKQKCKNWLVVWCGVAVMIQHQGGDSSMVSKDDWERVEKISI